MKTINYQFKVLIAFAMIFVVCGHVGCDAFSLNGIFNYDSFHMPLFLFISGYFFKYKDDKTIKQKIFKCCKRLLFPLMAWNLVYGGLLTYMRHHGPFYFSMGDDLSLYTFFYRSLTMGDAFQFNIASWFIMTLFIVKCFNYLLRYCINKSMIQFSEKGYLCLFFLLVILGILLGKSDIVFDFKVLLVRVLYSSLWFELGIFYNMCLEKYDTISNHRYFIILLSIQALLLCITHGKNESIVYAGIFPFSVFTTLLFAFNGIAFWLRISRLLTPILKESNSFMYLANHTFSVMMHQGFFIKMFNGVFYIIFLHSTRFQDFDPIKFQNEIWYIYLPHRLAIFNNLDVIVGIVMPLVLVYFLEYTENCLKKIIKCAL